MRIAVLEDDPDQLAVAILWLEEKGHAVHGFTRGAEILKALARETFDLAILDWMVPDLTGEEVLGRLLALQRRVPVMFATAKDEEQEIAHILTLGADDYVVKPLRRLEFLARIEALGRRYGVASGPVQGALDVGPYQVNPRTRSIALSGAAVKMTPRMFALAHMIFKRPGALLSRAHIYEEVWGQREQLDTRTVDTHVSRLRQALELDGRHGWRLASVYQLGYRLEETA